jgi:hypothetical protein
MTAGILGTFSNLGGYGTPIRSHAKAQRRKGSQMLSGLCAFAPLRETLKTFTPRITIGRSEGVIARSEGPFAFSWEFISLSGIPKAPSDPLKSPFEGEKGHPDLRKGRSEGAKARSRELKRPSARPFGPSTRPKGGSERPKAALAGLFGCSEGPKGTIDPSNALEVPA